MKSPININAESIKQLFVNFLVPIVALGLTGALIFFVILPSVKALPGLKKQLEDKTMLEQQLNTKVGDLNKLVNFKTVVDENSSLVSNALTSEALVPQLLTQVDQIAQDSGLKVDKLSYSFTDPSKAPVTDAEAAVKPAFSTVNVNLGVLGNVNQLITFLSNIENAARLVDVTSFRYTLNDKSDVTALDMTIILKSPYVFVESNAVTDDPITLNISDKKFTSLMDRIKLLKFYQISVTKDFGDQVQESTESTSSVH
ncbi:MAG TPA: type 4a pilus biogenesis protein PilO [Candidatus Saccharimonadales bacterium]|nr:type 4a pilus biogenesis protein PilO [Candidatus Saccharimonadales bacterium]